MAVGGGPSGLQEVSSVSVHPPSSSLLPSQAILSEPSGSGCQPSPLDRDVLENPGSPSSSLSNALLEQLEARVKELKVWLRDTELLIFNSCLREHKDAAQQLHSFKVAANAAALASGGRG